MADQGLQAPHGPDVTGNRGLVRDITENERQIFDYLIRPDDSYNANGVYWADLPIGQRIGFVSKVDAQESRRELAVIGKMMKADPLSPIGWYFRNAVIPGAGLLLEGYVLFSIGNLTPLFSAPGAFTQCWSSPYKECSKNWVAAVAYLEIIGIIVGQVLVGVVGDWLGRRFGLIQDATIMFVGLLMITAAWGTTLNGWVICYAWSLFFYSVGVGGEYPMTATSGMENAVGAGKVSTKEDRLHRGRKVTGAFLMQGWGQFLNQVILILLLIVTNSGDGDPPYLQSAVQWTYRLSFAIPAVGTLWLVYYRMYKMRAASKQLVAAKKRLHVTGYDVHSLKLTFYYFGPRLIATAGGWFCNDVFFYGNKLFQGNFIKIISPGTSVMPNWIWNLINVVISLVGYYLASFLIDNKLYGRKMMQQVGFFACFILFIIPAFNFDYYRSKAGVHAFQAMYFLSGFFNQFGPNAVTFLVAAEVFPTPVRATAHGFSAACGKAGALLAAVLYNYISNQAIFYFVPWFGLVGMLVTFFFLPDTTGLDLKEQERRWAFIRSGREADYHGVAVHPKHLSLWERWRGVGKHYDPDLDYKLKIEEMRGEWEADQAAKLQENTRVAEKNAMAAAVGAEELEGDDVWTSDVSTYYRRTAPSSYQEKTVGSENDSL